MKAYLEILNNILDNGRMRGDRTKSGTLSIFDAQFRHDMSTGFPLLTTKSVPLRLIFRELRAFLRGEVHLESLIEHNADIWAPWRGRMPSTVERALTIDERDQWLEKHDPRAWAAMPLFTHENEKFHSAYDAHKVPRTVTESGPANDQALNAPYGVGWRAYRGRGKTVDQIDYIMDLLKNNPDSRRILVSAWDPANLPDESLTPQENVAKGNDCLTPCHWAFELYTEVMTTAERLAWCETNDKATLDFHNVHGKMTATDNLLPKTDEEIHTWLTERGVPERFLSLKWHQRSVDSIVGLPFNIPSYGLLLLMIANAVNMAPRVLAGDLTNVHIYHQHLDAANEQLMRASRPLPVLTLKTKREKLEDYEWEDVVLSGYDPHPAIKVAPAV